MPSVIVQHCNTQGRAVSYRSFSSDLRAAKRNASLKLMQYFLSHLSLSYEFVLSSRNKSKRCTITTAALHRLLEIVTKVTSFHRNLISMMRIRVILMTSGQWSEWHWLVSFISFMTTSNDDSELLNLWYVVTTKQTSIIGTSVGKSN